MQQEMKDNRGNCSKHSITITKICIGQGCKQNRLKCSQCNLCNQFNSLDHQIICLSNNLQQDLVYILNSKLNQNLNSNITQNIKSINEVLRKSKTILQQYSQDQKFLFNTLIMSFQSFNPGWFQKISQEKTYISTQQINIFHQVLQLRTQHQYQYFVKIIDQKDNSNQSIINILQANTIIFQQSIKQIWTNILSDQSYQKLSQFSKVNNLYSQRQCSVGYEESNINLPSKRDFANDENPQQNKVTLKQHLTKCNKCQRNFQLNEFFQKSSKNDNVKFQKFKRQVKKRQQQRNKKVFQLIQALVIKINKKINSACLLLNQKFGQYIVHKIQDIDQELLENIILLIKQHRKKQQENGWCQKVSELVQNVTNSLIEQISVFNFALEKLYESSNKILKQIIYKDQVIKKTIISLTEEGQTNLKLALSSVKNKYIIKMIKIAHNNISTIISLRQFHLLQKLYLNNNHISKINNLQNLKNLQQIDISHNQIQTISDLDTLNHLKLLNLSFNKISEITGLDNLQQLEDLKLNKNQISKIKGLNNLKCLKAITLSQNKIHKIQGFDNNLKLFKIHLANNNINTIQNLIHLSNLRHLDLCFNNIQTEANYNAKRQLENNSCNIYL